MKINRTKLLESLALLEPGVAAKDVAEQSTSVAFVGGRAWTYNDRTACSAECELAGLGDDWTVEVALLTTLLKKLSDEELDCELGEGKDELIVKGGSSRRAGIRIEREVRLPVDVVEKPKGWEPVPDGLLKALDLVRQCATRDQSQPVLACVHFASGWVEAADEFQIGRYTVETGVEKEVLVNAAVLQDAVDFAPTKWARGDAWMHFRKGKTVMSVRQDQANYPDLGQHLEVDGMEVSLPKGITDAVDKAGVFTSADDANCVTVELRPGKLKLSGRGPKGWYSEVQSVEYKGDSLKFLVAAKLLVEVVKKADRCTIGKGKIGVKVGDFRAVFCTEAQG